MKVRPVLWCLRHLRQRCRQSLNPVPTSTLAPRPVRKAHFAHILHCPWALVLLLLALVRMLLIVVLLIAVLIMLLLRILVLLMVALAVLLSIVIVDPTWSLSVHYGSPGRS